MTAVPATIGPGGHSRGREAQLLAGLLRSSRLTLLCGEPGSGKTVLLQQGVMPLLRRRAEDRLLVLKPTSPSPARPPGLVSTSGEASRVVIPFPERRRRSVTADGAGSNPPLGEFALYFDDWRPDPLPHLRRHLRASLGLRTDGPGASYAGSLVEEIESASRGSGRHLLILLDGFERYLQASPLRTDIERFADQFVQAVNTPGLPANFVLAMRTDARPLLDRFRGRLQGLDRNWLNLTAPLPPNRHGDTALARPPLVAVPSPAAAPGQAAEPAEEEGPATPPEAEVPVAAVPAVTDAGSAWASSDTPAQAFDSATYQPARGRSVQMAWLLAALLLAGAVAWWVGSRTPIPLPLPGVAEPSPAAGLPAKPLPAPAWAIQTGLEQRTDARVASELVRALPAGWFGPPLQIAHYDALRAARQGASTGLRIVAPLFPEELHLLVRADSPLRFIHQIRDQAINVGPSRAGQPATGELLYERMFGRPLPASQVRSLGFHAALQALAAGTTDVVVLVDAQPSAWLAELSPETRRSVKLLALAPTAPESRRAMQVFLPATLDDSLAAPDMPTLAVMSFLVAGEAEGSGAANGPPAADRPLADLAHALCQALPGLRKEGHPKWRDVQPALELPVGWPYADEAHTVFRGCATRP